MILKKNYKVKGILPPNVKCYSNQDSTEEVEGRMYKLMSQGKEVIKKIPHVYVHVIGVLRKGKSNSVPISGAEAIGSP
jgi:hypothetical protein